MKLYQEVPKKIHRQQQPKLREENEYKIKQKFLFVAIQLFWREKGKGREEQKKHKFAFPFSRRLYSTQKNNLSTVFLYTWCSVWYQD